MRRKLNLSLAGFASLFAIVILTLVAPASAQEEEPELRIIDIYGHCTIPCIFAQCNCVLMPPIIVEG